MICNEKNQNLLQECEDEEMMMMKKKLYFVVAVVVVDVFSVVFHRNEQN